MGFISEFWSLIRAILLFITRMRVHSRWVAVGNELGLQTKYPARMYGEVGEVWVAVWIGVSDHGLGDPMIFLESSPNTPLPSGVDAGFLNDVIFDLYSDNQILLKEINKMLGRAQKVRQQAIIEDPSLAEE